MVFGRNKHGQVKLGCFVGVTVQHRIAMQPWSQARDAQCILRLWRSMQLSVAMCLVSSMPLAVTWTLYWQNGCAYHAVPAWFAAGYW